MDLWQQVGVTGSKQGSRERGDPRGNSCSRALTDPSGQRRCRPQTRENQGQAQITEMWPHQPRPSSPLPPSAPPHPASSTSFPSDLMRQASNFYLSRGHWKVHRRSCCRPAATRPARVGPDVTSWSYIPGPVPAPLPRPGQGPEGRRGDAHVLYMGEGCTEVAGMFLSTPRCTGHPHGKEPPSPTNLQSPGRMLRGKPLCPWHEWKRGRPLQTL